MDLTDAKVFGRPVDRIEDRALVTGRGRYVDDLRPEGCLSAAFYRSPYAHARIKTIDTTAARAMPGVVAVLTIEDLRPYLTSDSISTGLPSAAIRYAADRPILSTGEVVYVGEAITLVIAASRSEAEDAVEAIDVDFEPLPVVADARSALRPGADRAHTAFADNLLASFGFNFGEVEAAFADAACVVSGEYEVHRGGSHSMEGRGVLAVPDLLTGRLTVWSSTQTPQALKNFLCQYLGREEQTVSVVLPDVGGGFGPKLVTYPEEIAVAAAALSLGRAVKWIEDRREHFISTTQERDQFWSMQMALDRDGAIRGIRGSLVHDHGAYTARGVNVPYGAAVTVPLPYNVPAYAIDIKVVLTNLVPVTPVRGAGQPQGAFVMERLLDKAAAVLGLDRREIRQRNLVRPEQIPCEKPIKLRDGTFIVLDSGDYPLTQRTAVEAADWEGFGARRRKAREAGRLLGIGLANYVEGTGRGPYETVRVRISRSGKILVSTGAAAMGQGTATMLAQIIAEQLGGDLANISVVTGDTSESLGFGGFNSRQTVTAGSSAFKAATLVRAKVLQVAAHLLETTPDELVIDGSSVRFRLPRNRGLSLAEIAVAAAGLPGFQLPGIDSPGLDSAARVVLNHMPFSNGSAVAEVSVDPETGKVDVLRMTLAHDCGRIVNQKTVDGQLMGGLAHGIGNALFERMVFDEGGQPLTTTLADYLLVTASAMPQILLRHLESPSPLNELGMKGVGESGVIPAAGAIASAIDDALSHLSIHVDCAPLSPPRLRDRIRLAMAAAKGEARLG